MIYRLYIALFLNIISMNFAVAASGKSESFHRFPIGSIKPAGWLKIQMENDFKGFVGTLDRLVPDLMNDPIYINRLKKHSEIKNLGNLKEGDAGGDDQYKWWNSETQSNWWDAYIRHSILLGNKTGLENSRKYIERILKSQDRDGYIGIYDDELRYKFNSENGELWAKTTLLRGLLAYYEYSKDPLLWQAIVRSVDNVMKNYPINKSQPFAAGTAFVGGVAHGLTFTDILDRLYQLTGDNKYRDYALFLYNNFSQNYSSEKDAQLKNILDSAYRFQSHGVHTYEHLRPLIVAAWTSPEEHYQKALSVYLSRIEQSTTISGGPIGDEWIGERLADETHTGYEYCSIHELMDSYTVLLQKSGLSAVADQIEKIFYNAAQGSRNPIHSSIAYLKTDNSFEMKGTKNGEAEANRKQTRYKYSPAHQDVAVCCAPNAGRVAPYFIQSSWFREDDNTIVAAILCPTILRTTVNHLNLQISEITNYPHSNQFSFKLVLEKPAKIKLKIRKPEWAEQVCTNELYTEEDGYIIIHRKFATKDKIDLEYKTSVRVKESLSHQKYFCIGAQIFAKPIASVESVGRVYSRGYFDTTYSPIDTTRYEFIPGNAAVYLGDCIEVSLKNKSTNRVERFKLIPFGKTILRQVTF